MIASAVASPEAINSGIWSRRHRESFPSGFSSVSRNSTFYPIEKGVARISFRAPGLHIVGQASVRPLVSKVENNNKIEAKPLKTKTSDYPASLFDDASLFEGRILKNSGRAAKTSTKEATVKSYSSNFSTVIRYPLGTEAATKAMVESNTLVFVVDKRADKTIIKDTFEKMFKIKAKKVNTLMTSDGRKKAFIMLARDLNAVDVAKRIKII
ncbi:hypothetical protein CASFOL_015320 [Castilleja foliolosa]|uniref:Uncharacterized protein n=1 Tax=Castilleja foliolosa TaxID=1961234 RepID=A0ABD3DHC7_9LAMI